MAWGVSLVPITLYLKNLGLATLLDHPSGDLGGWNIVPFASGRILGRSLGLAVVVVGVSNRMSMDLSRLFQNAKIPWSIGL